MGVPELRSTIILSLLSLVFNPVSSTSGSDFVNGANPRFVCTPLPADADPTCFPPHGAGAGGSGRTGHQSPPPAGWWGASEEAKATILHLRESLVQQKETILDQRETIRELTAKLSLCEGFGRNHYEDHHEGPHGLSLQHYRIGGHHQYADSDHHNSHPGYHGGPFPDSAPHHPSVGGHRPDGGHGGGHQEKDKHPTSGESSPEQTERMLQALKERLNNLQKRNSSIAYSSSLKELLQRKINTLEDQLHHSNRHHDDHDTHDDHDNHDDDHDDHHRDDHDDHDDHHHDDHDDHHDDHDNHHDDHDQHHDDHDDNDHHHDDHDDNDHHHDDHDDHDRHHEDHPTDHMDDEHIGHSERGNETEHNDHHDDHHEDHDSYHDNGHGDHDDHHQDGGHGADDHHDDGGGHHGNDAVVGRGYVARTSGSRGGFHPNKLETMLNQLAGSNRKKIHSPFQISFPMRTNYMYGRVKKTLMQEIFALTLCLWLRAGVGPGMGTPFSYSAPGQANELVLIEWGSNPMELLIDDKAATLPLTVSDGKWHHVCVTWSTREGHWEAYQDGIQRGSGLNLSPWHPIKPGGVFVLGQEQDTLGGRFDATQSFVGELSDLQMWSHVLSASDIYSLASCGSHLRGDVISWSDAEVELHGGVAQYPFDPCH